MMPTTDPSTLEDFPADTPSMVYLGDSGIVLGDVDAFGCLWKDLDGSPWGPKPSPREESGDRAFDHGQWDATRYYGPRSWGINGSVRAPDHAALHQARQRLHAAVGVRPRQVRVTEPGFDGYATARQQGEIAWTEHSHTYATFSIGLYAADPLIYSNMLRAFSLAFPTRSGGLTWPATWPATWTGVTEAGSVQLYNPSTEDLALPLQLEVTGPVNNLRVTLVDADSNVSTLTVNNPVGNTLTAGQTMTIDTGRHEVLLLGTASRRSWASGQWPLIPPGLSTLAIAGSDTTSVSLVSGSYRAIRV